MQNRTAGIALLAMFVFCHRSDSFGDEPAGHLLALEIGTVTVSAHRPGTDHAWDTPAPAAKRDICSLFDLLPAYGRVLDKLCGVYMGARARRQTHDATAPDIFVRLEASGRSNVGYRTYTARNLFSHTFNERIVLPVDAIPAAGLRVMVVDDDSESGADEETIGSMILSRGQLLGTAQGDQATLVLRDGGVEKLELSVLDEAPAPQEATVVMKARQGMRIVPDLDVQAGQIVEIQSEGRYQVNGTTGQWIGPMGDGSSTPERALGVDALARVAHGGAVAFVGRERSVHTSAAPGCTRFVAPHSGVVVVGVNDKDPSDNFGALAFGIRVSNPSSAEWSHLRTDPRCTPMSLPPLPQETVADGYAWSAKAADLLRRIFDGPVAERVATRIQQITHPTGAAPEFAGARVDVEGDAISVAIRTNWRGGFLGKPYSTVVVWRLDQNRHIQATVAQDTAPFLVAAPNQQALDRFFQADLYRDLRHQLGD